MYISFEKVFKKKTPQSHNAFNVLKKRIVSFLAMMTFKYFLAMTLIQSFLHETSGYFFSQRHYI